MGLVGVLRSSFSRLLLSRIPLQASFIGCLLLGISQHPSSSLVGFVDPSTRGVVNHLVMVVADEAVLISLLVLLFFTRGASGAFGIVEF